MADTVAENIKRSGLPFDVMLCVISAMTDAVVEEVAGSVVVGVG